MANLYSSVCCPEFHLISAARRRYPFSTERLGNLSELALILHVQRPHVQTEWDSLANDVRAFPPVVLDGIEATLVSESSEEPSPPLFKCADEIISASGERIKFRLSLHAIVSMHREKRCK